MNHPLASPLRHFGPLRFPAVSFAGLFLLVFAGGCSSEPASEPSASNQSSQAPRGDAPAEVLPSEPTEFAESFSAPAAPAPAPQYAPAPAPQYAPAPAPQYAPAPEYSVAPQYAPAPAPVYAPPVVSPEIATPPAFAIPEEPMTARRSMMARSSTTSEALEMQAAPAAEPHPELPAGSSHSPELGYATVQVFYATDRARDPLPLDAYQISGAKQPVMLLGVLAIGCALAALLAMFRRRNSVAVLAVLGTATSGGMAAACILMGTANIEKHGVAYNSERGTLSRGVCEVTVPDSHQRGQVERPSLLRFEFAEDQRKHLVLKSAVELTKDDFQRRLSGLVDESAERNLLVFIHGYNVDFESAVQRTAQIAVDLPFHGVPVCYSWPSQGTLWGYTIDENNAAWTTSHLRSFLLELAETSGADSINLVAHSMGNRALTSALSEISFQMSEDQPPPFDRVVLAAPDIDADYFQRDLAPRLLETARHVTLYASSDDRALIASKQVHGYPRAGESGEQIVVVPGIETIDVSGIDLSLLGHSYYGDNGTMLRDLFQLVHDGLHAGQRSTLLPRVHGALTYWKLATAALAGNQGPEFR